MTTSIDNKPAAAEAQAPVPTLVPRNLNHFARPVQDIVATHQFWTEVMGCEFKGAFRLAPQGLMTSGEYAPEYIHTFYAMADGSCVAFFELATPFEQDQEGTQRWTKHFAMSVGSHAELSAWEDHLRSHNVDFIGEIDHSGYFYSIYFQDPSGQRLELTYQPNPLTEEFAEAGLDTLRDWAKDRAAGVLNTSPASTRD